MHYNSKIALQHKHYAQTERRPEYHCGAIVEGERDDGGRVERERSAHWELECARGEAVRSIQPGGGDFGAGEEGREQRAQVQRAHVAVGATDQQLGARKWKREATYG